MSDITTSCAMGLIGRVPCEFTSLLIHSLAGCRVPVLVTVVVMMVVIVMMMVDDDDDCSNDGDGDDCDDDND